MLDGEDNRKMSKRLRNLVLVVGVVVLAYVGTYLFFRVSHTQVWEKDGKAYVIFPKNAIVLWYFYRPMTYVDGAITGMRFHIGAHR
jgi:flagellar basal body-associated protein FliL